MSIATENFYSTLCADVDMIEVVQEFLDEMPMRLAQMQGAIEERNFGELARFSHQLKGAGGSYGFPQLTPAAARLEQLAKQQAEDSQLVSTLDEIMAITGKLHTVPQN